MIIKDTLKNSLNIGLVGLVGIMPLIGCGGTETEFQKNGEFRGYTGRIVEMDKFRFINLYDPKDNSLLTATDGFDSKKDGRFDEIILSEVKNGSSLEKYANIDSLELAYNTIKREGEIK